MPEKNENLRGLNSPERSLRLYAVEQLMQGDSGDVLKALQERLPLETDEECKRLIEQAVVFVGKRINSKDVPVSIPEDWESFFSSAITSEKLQVLSQLSPGQAKKLAPYAPKLVVGESDHLVGAALIRSCGKFWPKKDFQVLAQRVHASSISVRTAALEALIQAAPEALLKQLPRLLTSLDPRIRTLAIRGLATIDMDEAIAHLEYLLFSGDAAARHTCLQACLYLPFLSVKQILLKFLAIETDLDLLEEGGLVFQINPDTEAPYRLWELSQRLPRGRREILAEVVQGACQVIEKSGILKDRFKNYLRQLKSWMSSRRASAIVQEFTMILGSGESLSSDQLAFVERAVKNTPFRKACESALFWPISDEVKDVVKSWLDVKKASVAPAPPAEISSPLKPVPGAASTGAKRRDNEVSGKSEPIDTTTMESLEVQFEKADEIGRVRIIGSLLSEDGEDGTALLRKQLDISDQPPKLLVALLRAALRLEVGDAVELTRGLINTKDPALVSISVEYLGTFDTEDFFPKLGYFLQSENGRIKGAALKVLQRYDGAQALSMLKAILQKKTEDSRGSALACLMHFDFPLVRTILVDFILQNPSDHEVDLILCLFQSNPDPENLYDLYRLEKLLPQKLGEKALIARRQNQENLVAAGQLQNQEFVGKEEEWKKRFRADEAKKSKPLSDYALKKLVPDSQDSIGDQIAAFLVSTFGTPVRMGMGGGVIFILILWSIYSIIPSSTGVPEKSRTIIEETKTPRSDFRGNVDSPKYARPIGEDIPPPELFKPTPPEISQSNIRQQEERAAAIAAARDRLAKPGLDSDAGFFSDHNR